jgi:hypothetical protein
MALQSTGGRKGGFSIIMFAHNFQCGHHQIFGDIRSPDPPTKASLLLFVLGHVLPTCEMIVGELGKRNYIMEYAHCEQISV